MNLLANAIDVFDEAVQNLLFKALEKSPQSITITTELINKASGPDSQENWVKIRIFDNGKGMSEEVKTRIFDHLFTTKGAGKGTGRGLAIARQIIVKAHGGILEGQL